MKKNLVNIFSYSWGLMMSTTPTWVGISNKNNKENESFTKFVVPWVVLCTLIVFVFETIYAESKHVETGFIYAFVNLLSLFGAYFFTKTITNSYFKKNLPELFSKINIEKIVAYSFAVVFVIKIITTIIPSLFFLQILNIYTIYIVWDGCRVIFNINEDERGKIMLLISLSIIFTPAIINKIVFFMLPAF